jgi:steroid 5-alpha reductase family enzyme
MDTKNAIRALAVLVICLGVAAGIAIAGSQNTISFISMPVLYSLVILAFATQWLVFIPSYLLKTEKCYDLTGSGTFIACTLLVAAVAQPLTLHQVICASMVLIWAARLGSFLFLRIHKDGVDTRFDEIKHNPYRFFVTWTIQGLWVIITAGALYTAIASNTKITLGLDLQSTLVYLGLALWVFGFSLEVVADYQKRVFKQNPENKGKFINVGLWARSRHPNYFGEILLWFGAALTASVALSGWQYITLISPFFVLFLLTKVSGIPMLEAKAEKRWGQDADYIAYKQSTNRLWVF